MMIDDEIDRILAEHDPIVPSAAFTASVMSVVEGVASSPPPLFFPWWRAAPGLVALGGVFVTAQMVGEVPSAFASALRALHSAPAELVALALTATVAAAQFSTRLIRSGG
jgi:hypothetical protein